MYPENAMPTRNVVLTDQQSSQAVERSRYHGQKGIGASGATPSPPNPPLEGEGLKVQVALTGRA
jgi:hypothetical protein